MTTRVTIPMNVRDRAFAADVIEPDVLSPDPALVLTFALGRETSLSTRPHDIPATTFLAAGHRALSFDPPNHGDRVDRFGAGIDGMRDALLGGIDPFASFVEDGVAVIDRCLAIGLVRPGRIVVAGTSRSGYLAIRLAADDPRIVAVAAFAPVTEWAVLREFAARGHDPVVRGTDLSRYVDELVGRPLMVVIGSADERVGTDACRRFEECLRDAHHRAGVTPDVRFVYTGDIGHSVGDAGRVAGSEFLLRALERPPLPGDG